MLIREPIELGINLFNSAICMDQGEAIRLDERLLFVVSKQEELPLRRLEEILPQ